MPKESLVETRLASSCLHREPRQAASLLLGVYAEVYTLGTLFEMLHRIS